MLRSFCFLTFLLYLPNLYYSGVGKGFSFPCVICVLYLSCVDRYSRSSSFDLFSLQAQGLSQWSFQPIALSSFGKRIYSSPNLAQQLSEYVFKQIIQYLSFNVFFSFLSYRKLQIFHRDEDMTLKVQIKQSTETKNGFQATHTKQCQPYNRNHVLDMGQSQYVSTFIKRPTFINRPI